MITPPRLAPISTRMGLDHLVGWCKFSGSFAPDAGRCELVFRQLSNLAGSFVSVSPRYYHTAEHVVTVWSHLYEWSRASKYYQYLCASARFALFHDWVYYADPALHWRNERDSTTAMRLASGRGDVAADASLVTEGILALALHTTTQHGLPEICQLWLDADLAGLASSKSQYDDNSRNVARELGFGGNELAWIGGRIAFLEKMLCRNTIYYIRKELEELARANMGKELIVLRLQLGAAREQAYLETGRPTL